MNTHLIVECHAVIFGRGIPAGECEVAEVEESKRESFTSKLRAPARYSSNALEFLSHYLSADRVGHAHDI